LFKVLISEWKGGISTCLSLKDRGGAGAAKGGSKGSKSRKSVPYPPEKDGVFFRGWVSQRWMRFHIDLGSNLRIDDLTSNLRIEKISQE